MATPQCECAAPIRYSGRMGGKEGFSIRCPKCERGVRVVVDFNGDRTIAVSIVRSDAVIRTILISEDTDERIDG